MFIDVLDAMPGAGKTEYFIRHAVRLSSQLSPVHVFVYAAPTLKLLREVKDRLESVIPKNKHNKIILDESVGKVRTLTEQLGLLSPKNAVKPGSIILTTHECWMRLPRLLVERNKPYSRIIENTHLFFDEARQCLQERDMQIKIPEGYLGNILKLFNAAVDNKSEKERYSKMFELQKIILDRKKKDYVKASASDAYDELASLGNFAFRLNRPVPGNTKAEVEDKIGSILLDAATNANSEDRKLCNKIIDDLVAFNGKISKLITEQRTAVYLWVYPENAIATVQPTSPASKKIDFKDSVKTTECFAMTRPTNLFADVGKITILSAFFKDSQMYHYLVRELWTDEEGKPIPDPFIFVLDPESSKPHQSRWSLEKRQWIGDVASRSIDILNSTRRDLSIAVLTDDTANNLSKLSLTHDWLVNQTHWTGSKCDPGLRSKLEKQNPRLKTKGETSLANIAFNGSHEDKFNLGITDEMVSQSAPPLMKLVSRGITVAKAWARESGYPGEFFVILNVGKGNEGIVHVPTGVKNVDVCRDLIDHGTASVLYRSITSAKASYNLTEEDSKALNYPKTVAHIATNNRILRAVATTKTNGVNEFKDLRGIIHLAALNMTPSTINFLESVMDTCAADKIEKYKELTGDTLTIPHYVVDMDTVLENIVQSMYRISIRTPSQAPLPAILITSHGKSAEYLEEKLTKINFMLTGKPNKITLHRFSNFEKLSVAKYSYVENYDDRLDRTTKATKASVKSRVIPYSEAEKKMVASIANRLCQLKKDPDRNEERIKELEEERFIIKKIALTRK